MPESMFSPNMLGAIARSKSILDKNTTHHCRKCDSTNVYEVEETKENKIITYLVCENCNHREKIKERRKNLLEKIIK